jgi:hypothetical protein
MGLAEDKQASEEAAHAQATTPSSYQSRLNQTPVFQQTPEI